MIRLGNTDFVTMRVDQAPSVRKGFRQPPYSVADIICIIVLGLISHVADIRVGNSLCQTCTLDGPSLTGPEGRCYCRAHRDYLCMIYLYLFFIVVTAVVALLAQ